LVRAHHGGVLEAHLILVIGVSKRVVGIAEVVVVHLLAEHERRVSKEGNLIMIVKI